MNLEFLSIDVGSLIFTLCNTLILFLVIKHFLFGRVNKVLENRQSEVSSTYEKADDTMKNAQKLESDYKALITNAKDESAEMIKAATKKAQMRSDEIIGQAKIEANSMVNRANDEIEREKKRTRSQIKDEISDLAVQVAGKVVEKEINSSDHERLINDFIENVGEFE